MPLEEQFHRDIWFLDTVATQGNMNEMFTSRVNLLPPDIMKQIEQGWQDKGYTDKTKWDHIYTVLGILNATWMSPNKGYLFDPQ